MTARLSLLFSYDKYKQIFHYYLLCIYTICAKSVVDIFVMIADHCRYLLLLRAPSILFYLFWLFVH